MSRTISNQQSAINNQQFPRSAVTIGMFDGVHLGHRSLLAALRSEAERIEGEAVVLTFDRHPMELLASEHAPLYINTLEQRVRLLEDAGAEQVVVARFDNKLADMSPEEFVDQTLIGDLKAAAVIVGTNFRFGKKRAGDVELLRKLGDERGFRVVGVEPAMVHGAPVSSTRVRNAIERGDIKAAAELLGRPFAMLGRVVTGRGIGRELGFPTANIDVGQRQITPCNGIYAVRVMVAGKEMSGVCSIGVRPTLGPGERVTEVYIEGFEGNLYGVELEVAFYARMRDEIKFDSLDSLTAQIALDVEEAKRLLGAS